MDWKECENAAYEYLRQNGVPGVELARRSKLFAEASGDHLDVLRAEYLSDYGEEWPGCSRDRQWTAVNWDDQIYVNSKDKKLVSKCANKDPRALAAVLSHEIFHIKAKSNYCSNETICLFEHELMAHMYEDLLNKDGDPQKARLTGPDIKRLSKQVFNNYLSQTLKPDMEKQEYLRKLLTKKIARKFHKTGIPRARATLHDVNLMTKIGLSHFE